MQKAQCYANAVQEGIRTSRKKRYEYIVGLGLSGAAFIILGGATVHLLAKQPAFSPYEIKVAKNAARAASSGNGKVNNPTNVKSASATQSVKSCSISPMTDPLLVKSLNPSLRKLAEYEQLCAGAVTDTIMVFTGMPTDLAQASENATDMAATLKEFAKYGLHPLVVMEPTTSLGLINLEKFSQGYYDLALNAYYQKLKSQGITDTTMGTWVPFPESNIPEWGSTNPAQFGTNFVRAANIQKQHFPDSKISIILDSLSYPPGVLDWDGGAYVSLSSYLQAIPKGLVDSFGYQGFPWAAPAGEPFSNLDAAKFLKPDLAKEAAEILGTKNIWLNTGTYKTFYSTNLAKRVEASAELRAQILASIMSQAEWLKSRGFTVTISLFAENKTETAEDVDWSYWTGSDPSGPHADVLKSFLADLKSKSIGFWLFDSL